MDNINIRLASDNDFEAIYSIWLDGIANSFVVGSINEEKLKDRFMLNFNQREGIFNFWVAVGQDDTVCGWQSLMKCSNNPFKEDLWAESSTYIAKNNRLKGVGKLLLSYANIEAEKSQLEYIIAFIGLENQAVKKITQETGWLEVGLMPKSKKNINTIGKLFIVRPI